MLQHFFFFNSLSSNKSFLACRTNTDSSIRQYKDLDSDHNSLLSLKISSNLEILVNWYNATPANYNKPEKLLHLNIMTLINWG